MSKKEIGLALVLFAGGAILAFFLFSIAFNTPIRKSIPDLLALAAIAAASAFVAGYLDNSHWRRLSALLAAPSVLMCLTLEVMLLAEDRWDLSWIMCPAIIAALCLTGGYAGKKAATASR